MTTEPVPSSEWYRGKINRAGYPHQIDLSFYNTEHQNTPAGILSLGSSISAGGLTGGSKLSSRLPWLTSVWSIEISKVLSGLSNSLTKENDVHTGTVRHITNFRSEIQLISNQHHHNEKKLHNGNETSWDLKQWAWAYAYPGGGKQNAVPVPV